jgi:hypothetical protein
LSLHVGAADARKRGLDDVALRRLILAILVVVLLRAARRR